VIQLTLGVGRSVAHQEHIGVQNGAVEVNPWRPVGAGASGDCQLAGRGGNVGTTTSGGRGCRPTQWPNAAAGGPGSLPSGGMVARRLGARGMQPASG